MASYRISSKEIDKAFHILKGIFAVNKPKNTTTTDVMNIITLQISDDIGFPIHDYGFEINHGGRLEYPADGVLVCGLGKTAKKKLNYFCMDQKKYNITLKLGHATDTGDFHGNIIEEKSFAHIDRFQVEKALKQFIGPIKLKKTNLKAIEMDRGSIVKTIQGKHFENFASAIVDNISCIDFEPPYISLELIYRNQFHIRSFAHDFGNVLGSCAHIASIERTSQGIYSKEDALVSYQWSWPNIQKAIELTKPQVYEYCKIMKKKLIKEENSC